MTRSQCADDVWTRVVSEIAELPGVVQAKMLRSTGLRVGRRFFAFPSSDAVVVKLPARRVSELVDSGAGGRYRSGKRVMREWIAVPLDHEDSAIHLLREAYFFAQTQAPERCG